MTADSLGHLLHGRKSGPTWMVRCPAHDDKNPSLALRDKDGKLLLKCHAGCPNDDVVAALKDRGLWESEQKLGPIIAEYNYVDERGKLLYQVTRHEPKDFRQRRPDGYGGFIQGIEGVRRVLYKLREVLTASIVFLVEGEKDVETLREYGFIATTNSGGAKAPWLPSFTAALCGKEVIVIPDDDEPGLKRVMAIARVLIGNAAKVVILQLPGAKDITEWFDRGHSELELIALAEGDQVNPYEAGG